MAEAVETMVGQAAPSVLADEVICPALREYGARPPPADRQAPDPTAAAHCSLPPAHASRVWTTRRAVHGRREVRGGDGGLEQSTLQARWVVHTVCAQRRPATATRATHTLLLKEVAKATHTHTHTHTRAWPSSK